MLIILILSHSIVVRLFLLRITRNTRQLAGGAGSPYVAVEKSAARAEQRWLTGGE